MYAGSKEPSSLVCRTVWFFGEEEWLLHQQLLETVPIVLIIHCREILCNQINTTLGSKSNPHRVVHSIICELCRGLFSLSCLNIERQVFQIVYLFLLKMSSSSPTPLPTDPSNPTEQYMGHGCELIYRYVCFRWASSDYAWISLETMNIFHQRKQWHQREWLED